MKFSRLALLALISTLALKAHAAGESRVVFIDVQKTVQASVESKKERAELQRDYEAKKKDFDKQSAALKADQAALEKRKYGMTTDAYDKAEEAFQSKVIAYQKDVSQTEAEMQKRQQTIMAPVLDKLNALLKKVAKDKGYAAIEAVSPQILYVDPANDITEAIIEEMARTTASTTK